MPFGWTPSTAMADRRHSTRVMATVLTLSRFSNGDLQHLERMLPTVRTDKIWVGCQSSN